MGRPEAPLDSGNGPLAELAEGLRRLRHDCGGRSYRQLAQVANYAAPTLARAASGRVLPSWEVTRAYVVACGADPGQWRPVWAAAAKAVREAEAASRPGRSEDPAAAPPRQLPADLHDFVGRIAEAEILRGVAQAATGADASGVAPHLVVISGPGGIGKSTFAAHAAHQLAALFPDGQLYVDLRGADATGLTSPQVAARFVAALGGTVPQGTDPVASFRSLAAGRRLLILLDNALADDQITPLLPASPRSMVLVTSRLLLGTLAAARAVCLDVLSGSDAAELLIRAAGPDCATNPESTRSLADLCGRLPLALRVAGRRVACGPPGTAEWLADRLRDADHRLRRLAAANLDLTALFAVSYQPLDATSQRVFRQAGLFPGPDFTAAALAAAADLTLVDAECALERLLSASLIQPAEPGRYRMHDLLRLYARQVSDEAGDLAGQATSVLRLARWYLAMVDAVDRAVLPARGRPAPIGDPENLGELASQDRNNRNTAFSWFDAEHVNLAAVARAAARHGHHEIAWRIPVAMRGLQELRGLVDDCIDLHQAGLESARAIGDLAAQGWLLNGLGIAYRSRDAFDDAIRCYRQALAVRTEIGDARGQAVVLTNLGILSSAIDRYDEALDYLREALAIRDRLGDELDQSFALNSLGHVEHELGRFTDALDHLEAALRIRRRLGNRNGEAATLHCLGDTLTGLHRPLEALALLRRALMIFTELGNRYGEAVAWHSIGSAFAACGRPDHASRYLRRAISLYTELGNLAEQPKAVAELNALAAPASLSTASLST